MLVACEAGLGKRVELGLRLIVSEIGSRGALRIVLLGDIALIIVGLGTIFILKRHLFGAHLFSEATCAVCVAAVGLKLLDIRLELLLLERDLLAHSII